MNSMLKAEESLAINKFKHSQINHFISVPIIPEFIYDIRHPDAPLSSFPKDPPPITPSAYDVENPDSSTPNYGELYFTFD
jgi:DHA1 family solute carrier family 18 vesicular amine transporter 1/2